MAGLLPPVSADNLDASCAGWQGWDARVFRARAALSTGERIELVLPPARKDSPAERREAETQGVRLVIETSEAPATRAYDETITLHLPDGASLTDLLMGSEFEGGPLDGFRAHPLPFKVGLDGADQSFNLSGLATFSGFAEGWIVEDGNRGLLVMRLPSPDPDTCFVPLAVREEGGRRVVQIGSVGPDGDCHRTRSPYLHRAFAGGAVRFPATRCVFFDGGWEEGVRLFRAMLVRTLAGRLEGYRALPVTYNTYHDFGPSYSRADLIRAMKRVSELGAGLIHLDPGWETVWGSTVWDEQRLGPPEQIVAEAAVYGLHVGCWTSLHTTDPKIAEGCYALGPDGERRIAEDFGEVKLYGVCPASRWADVYRENLGRLIRAGFVFVNSDFHDWPWLETSCHDPSHGHAVPLSRSDWCEALNKMFAQLHETGGPVTIEMHDHVESGEYRTPVWYLYSRPGSYDEKWAYEFMWKTYADLLSHKLFALYHLRKAEPVPLFLHMNMITDNENALAFWYVASCVHHIGVGGALKASPAVFEGYRRAIALYNKHFEEFTQGQFIGIDELAHLHIHPNRLSAVLVCFNLEDVPEDRKILLNLSAAAPDVAAMRLDSDPAVQTGGDGWCVRACVGAKDVSVISLKFLP